MYVTFALAVAALFVNQAVADTVHVRSERHLQSFLRDSCDLGCDAFVYDERNPASLQALQEVRARPGVPLALVHGPDTEKYRQQPTPKLIEINAGRRRLRDRNLYRYDEVAGNMDQFDVVHIMVLGGVRPGEFVRKFAQQAEQDTSPKTAYVYVHPSLEHGSRQVIEQHKRFARALGASGHDTHFYELTRGSVREVWRASHPKGYLQPKASG